jgi:anti-anti-sigma factor
MALSESPSVIVPLRDASASAGDADRNVVWLRGEQDISTVGALWETMTRAIAVDDGAVVVDMSGVQFMGVAAVGVIIRAHEFLRLRSRTLEVRSPSTCARRAFDVCGLSDLVEPEMDGVLHPTGTGDALGTWVTVPATSPFDRRSAAPAPTLGAATLPVP